MSETLELAVVSAIVLAAAIYLLVRWRRPRRSCDACPAEPTDPERLVQLGRKVTAAGRRPPSAS
jgi:hypothetical protein